MYVFMSYQTDLLSECFVTHFTNIRALCTMYVFMSYQTVLLTECSITHFTNIRALTTMYALMSYQLILFTECLITYFTHKRMLTPTYSTGICAFSTLYLKLFIHSTLVKTQRINIRIYSDRKNSYTMYILKIH